MEKKQIVVFFLLIFGFLFINACSEDDEKPETETISEVPGAQEIVLHLEYQYGLGGYIETVYRPYLLFTNGSIYKNMETAVDNLDIQQSKQQEPDEWGTWEEDGGDLHINWNDDDPELWEEDMLFKTDPASAGQQVNGLFGSISGGGNLAFGGSILIFNATNISFDGDKFTYEITSGGTNDDFTSYSSEEKAGTYKLDGYTILLNFNNGQQEKKFFYFYPGSEDVIGIGSRYYVSD